MKKLIGILFLFSVLSSLAVAEVNITGNVLVPENSLVVLKATSTGTDAVYSWKVYGNNPASYKGFGDYLAFTGKAGLYKVWVVSSSIKDGKPLVEETEVEVIIGKLEPVPKPDDDKKDDPTPVPVTSKVWILVVEETATAASNRAKYFSDKDLITYIRAKSWRFRIFDKDVVDKDKKVPADLKPYIDRSVGKELPQLYIVTDQGKIRFENVLHKNPADLLKELKKIAGDK